MSLAEVKAKIAEARKAAALAEPYNGHTDAIDYIADALEEITKIVEGLVVDTVHSRFQK